MDRAGPKRRTSARVSVLVVEDCRALADLVAESLTGPSGRSRKLSAGGVFPGYGQVCALARRADGVNCTVTEHPVLLSAPAPPTAPER